MGEDMGGAEIMAGRNGNKRRGADGVHRPLYGVSCHGGGVVFLAQVGQDQFPGAAFHQLRGKFSGILIAEVAFRA